MNEPFIISSVTVYILNDEPKYNIYELEASYLRLKLDIQLLTIEFIKDENILHSIALTSNDKYVEVGKLGLLCKNTIINFSTKDDMMRVCQKIEEFSKMSKNVFTLRTDESSEIQYFHFYSYLSQQQNMMQDYIRTNTYFRSILGNLPDFKDKIVLDVGAGSGILSFFAAYAGAKRVYAIEASSMAMHAEMLVKSNNFSHIITIVKGKVEEVTLPECVDTIVSEPLGYMLLNERMLETYLHAKKWLKPQGRMFPSKGDLHITPFSDEALYIETYNKCSFWGQNSFYGINLCSLRQSAQKEIFQQPIVDSFDIRLCVASSIKYSIDFQTFDEKDLHDIEIPLTFTTNQSGHVHGLAFWFDVAFIGQTQTIWLSTSPTEPLTHWYQVRCLFTSPLLCLKGQVLSGRVVLKSNTRQSYDVDVELRNVSTGQSANNSGIDLKNPFFRYTAGCVQIPPGNYNTSPSENYFSAASTNGVPENLTNSHLDYAPYYNVTNGFTPAPALPDHMMLAQQTGGDACGGGALSNGVASYYNQQQQMNNNIPSPMDGTSNMGSYVQQHQLQQQHNLQNRGGAGNFYGASTDPYTTGECNAFGQRINGPNPTMIANSFASSQQYQNHPQQQQQEMLNAPGHGNYKRRASPAAPFTPSNNARGPHATVMRSSNTHSTQKYFANQQQQHFQQNHAQSPHHPPSG